jgi:glycosyltransferase involved in cell wall biosynthesis
VQSPEVSVVLPVRDGAETLEAALGSVLASRGVDFELICVDDRSGDATPRIIERFSRDPGVRGVSSRGSGIVAALEAGRAAARAPLVARMDADDLMHPERLAAQRDLLRREPDLALVGCGVESFRDGGLAAGYRIYTDWVNGLVSPEEIEREAFIECPVPHPTWMFRAGAVSAVGGYRDEPWPEDLDLLYRLLAAGYRIGKVPHLLHRWRDHPGRLSRVDPRYGRAAFARVKARFVGRIRPMAGAVVWGAGRTGRRMVRLLEAERIPTRALMDIHPDRIGSTWRGIPILSPDVVSERAPAWRAEGLRILAAVASRGARSEIRVQLSRAGLHEGQDFLMVA